MGIRDKIKTLQALRGILNVWEIIAVNRYKKYSAVVGAQLPYFLRLQEVLEHLYALYPGVRTELLQMREERRIDVLILTSDRGYVGDFITRTIRVVEELIEHKNDRKVKLFVAGRRGALNLLLRKESMVFEDVLTRDVNWEVVGRIKKVLIERYRRKLSDACYVVFQRPEVDTGEIVDLGDGKRKKRPLEGSPFLYAGFEEFFRLKPVSAVERGRCRPVVVRFLPPDIKKEYSKEIVLNIEAREEELLEELLELYLSFFIKEVFLEHFTSMNFARHRTISRILENMDKKLSTYKRLLNKLRQDRINTEIGDIVFSIVAAEERVFRAYKEETCTLEIDTDLEDDLVEKIKRELEKHGFTVGRVERRKLIGGFRLVLPGQVFDCSVEGFLNSLYRTRWISKRRAGSRDL